MNMLKNYWIVWILVIGFVFSIVSCSKDISEPTPGRKHFIIVNKIEISPQKDNYDQEKCLYFYTGWDYGSSFEQFNGSFYDYIGKYNIKDSMEYFSFKEIAKLHFTIDSLKTALQKEKEKDTNIVEEEKKKDPDYFPYKKLGSREEFIKKSMP